MIMRTKLLIAALFLLPGMLSAAGLGKLKTKSALGEPLRAEVELYEAYPEEVDTMVARLANADEYAAAGLSDAMPHQGIRCTLLRRNAGNHVLLIRSDKPVNDPFLEVLVKIESAKSNVDLIRQYTILLEPPKTSAKQDAEPEVAVMQPSAVPDARQTTAVATVADATTAGAETAPEKRHKHKKSINSDTASDIPKAKPVIAVRTETYTTQSGDILGKIAQKYQPAGVPLKKVMKMMFKLNPDAFENGKMRKLKAGVVLQIPTPEALGASGEAATTMASGASANEKGPAAETKPVSATVATPATSGISATAKTAPASAPAGQATPFVASPAVEKPSVATSTVTGTTSAAVSAQPATTVNSTTATTETTAAVSAAQANGDVTNPQPEVAPDQGPEVAMHMVKTPEVNLPPPPSLAPAEGSNTERGIMWRMILMLVLILLLTAAVAIWYFRRHAKPAALLAVDDATSASTDAALVAPDPEQGLTSEEIEEVERNVSSQTNQVHINEVDPVVEAEVLMSYGHDTKAEAILNQAMTTTQKPEVALALLNIYALRNDRQSFEFLANKVHTGVMSGEYTDTDVWQKVVSMGRQIDPDNILYQFVPESTMDVPNTMDTAEQGLQEDTQGTTENTLTDSMPAEASATVVAEQTPENNQPVKTDDNSLDFVLEVPTASEVHAEQEVQQPLEFHLDEGEKVEPTLNMDFDDTNAETIVLESNRKPGRRKRA